MNYAIAIVIMHIDVLVYTIGVIVLLYNLTKENPNGSSN